MTIEVKGTRSETSAQPPAEKFNFFNPKQRLTMLPVHVGAVIIMVALYVRSFFDSVVVDAQADPSRTKDKPEPEPDEHRMREHSDVRDHAKQEEASRAGRIVDFGKENPSQEIDWSPAALLADTATPFRFTRFSFEITGLSAFPSAYRITSSNDNRLAQSSSNNVDEVPTVSDPQSNRDEPEITDSGPSVPPGATKSNRAPKLEGPVRLNDVFAGQAVLFSLYHLLWGATDPDGDKLTVEDVSADTLPLDAVEGGWRVTTVPGMLGPVTLTYSITDGEAVVWQTAHFNIVRKTHTLMPDNDLFVGSPFDDDIDALAGDDIIDAMAGNDLVVGGAGNDHIMGGAGDDVLYGGTGDDVLLGGIGNDILYGGQGADRLFGEMGNDTLYGEDGDDYLDGGAGNDILEGGEGHDFLSGGTGSDIVLGGAGNDRLYGDDGDDVLDAGTGNDHLEGGSGNDILRGGAGNDVVKAGKGDDVVIGGAGDDDYDGGEGYDLLDYSESAEELLIHTGMGQASGNSIGDDQFSGFEEIIGGAGNDLFVINGSAHVLSGGRGRDTFVFEVTDNRPALSEDLVHDILDFVVGDRVRVRDYDISREARTTERDMFRTVYNDNDDNWLRSEFPILVTHGQVEGTDVTILAADINGDAVMDFTINIFGLHLNYVADTLSA
ncbi:calcium-binding protein [Pelagibacterium sp.]|uniref:calcium-binding protein n=1 Tax=Pelagibacterium sp. TaxID=1967288 RepID=UPI003A94D7B8